MMLFNDSTNIADTKCMERIQEGDESGLTELMGRYSSRLRKYMLNHYISAEMRDEVIQDTYTQVWFNASVFRIGEDVFRWVVSIAKYRMLDAVRNHRRHNRDIALSQMLYETESGLKDGYSCVDDVSHDAGCGFSVDDIIEAASDVLEPMYLDEVVAMYRGGSAEERSRETGECASTLRWRRSEALAQLRSSGKFTKQFANAFVD